jgi:hypothetical protein
MSAEGDDQYDDYECPYTEEELLRAEEEPGGRTLLEILRDLERAWNRN